MLFATETSDLNDKKETSVEDVKKRDKMDQTKSKKKNKGCVKDNANEKVSCWMMIEA